MGSRYVGFPLPVPVHLFTMNFLSDSASEQICGGALVIPSLSSLVVGVNVNPITNVTPVTQVNTVATAAVLAGILDNVNLAVNNTAFNFASI